MLKRMKTTFKEVRNIFCQVFEIIEDTVFVEIDELIFLDDKINWKILHLAKTKSFV